MKELIKEIVFRVQWLARGASMVLGLTVVLAVVLGVGTTALAALPGDPLKLGQLNAVDAASILVGRVNGAMLGIENQSPGSRGSAAPALSLKVAPNNPPLTANPEASTATNLSADELDGLDQGAFLRANGKASDADELDGKDSSQFLPTNGKANDSDQLDGKDSVAFFPSKTYDINVDEPGAGGGDWVYVFQGVHCDPGDKLLTGGAGSHGGYMHTDVLARSDPHNEGWYAFMVDNGQPGILRISIRCADFPPLR